MRRTLICSMALMACSAESGSESGEPAPDISGFDVFDGTPAGDDIPLDATPPDDGPAPDDTIPADNPIAPDDAALADLGTDDAGPEDAGPDVAAPEDAGPDAPPPPSCHASATITSPVGPDFVPLGAITFTATVATTDSDPVSAYTVSWESDGVALATSPVSADGTTSVALDLVTPGRRDVVARVMGPQGQACESEAPTPVTLHACAGHTVETFDVALGAAEWVTYGDAYWDSSGWLEMTGDVGDNRGAIYGASPAVAPGSVSFRFRFATGGGGDSTGADGFAATILKADSSTDVATVVAGAQGGGGLGYGYGGPYGPFAGNAFTVEVDTWYNQLNGAEYHTDPTQSDHLELTQNLDPSSSLAYYALPDIEDLVWHAVRVDISTNHMRVFYDGVVAIDTDVPDFKFRGGFVYFSGSTGYYYNFHRFDDLEILDRCEKGQ